MAKDRYEILNELNEKYDVAGNEITCFEEIDNFWNDFNKLYLMNKISEQDMNLCQAAVGIK